MFLHWFFSFLIIIIQYSYHRINQLLLTNYFIFLKIEPIIIDFKFMVILKSYLKLALSQHLTFIQYFKLVDLVFVHFLKLLLEHLSKSQKPLIELALNVFGIRFIFFLNIHLLLLLFLIIQLFFLFNLLHFKFFKLLNQIYLFLMFESFILYFV
jgi:hypothetical protein